MVRLWTQPKWRRKWLSSSKHRLSTWRGSLTFCKVSRIFQGNLLHLARLLFFSDPLFHGFCVFPLMFCFALFDCMSVLAGSVNCTFCRILFILDIIDIMLKHVKSWKVDRLVGLVVKASASRAEDSGFESRWRRDFFGVESYQWLRNWHSSGYPARRLAL